ncbi:HAD family hydrolase [Amycolatopsis sp. PS_44_ISF1]|uniref:HAD family hydrolase n=1 Tax=Amycolatopsis sp. PS_44_ISF1 TaxID=2974917 RepID=UPI0028DE3D09|nr:HAD family hydrolase [Amycolatopsis sp. PS_44_ISF1]MDT8914479.1 HAD family hydrolase [Amycolatopsis sp. PS_44_ISF1]
MSKSAVLFDIDGTLVDSNYLHVQAWVRAFAESGLAVDSWRVHRGIGMDSAQLVSELVGDRMAEKVGERAEARHSELYLESASSLRPFDQARSLLQAVSARGIEVLLVTSAGPDELDRLKQVLDLGDEVAGIVSGDDADTAKPEPDMVEVALDRAGVEAGRAVFVGDSIWDVVAAKRVSVPTIGLLSGGTSEAELTEAGAVKVYADAATLLDGLDGSPIGRMG